MNVLIDTNIALDVLLDRRPFSETSMRVIVLSEKRRINAFVSASAVTDIYYIIRKTLKSKNSAIELLKKFIKTINIAPVEESHIYEALDLNWNDFEDVIQYVVGKSKNVEYIVTRNQPDFQCLDVKIVSPEDFLKIIETGSSVS
jgi:predicted nucleic acid-binding protein